MRLRRGRRILVAVVAFLLAYASPAGASTCKGYTWYLPSRAGTAVWPTGVEVWIVPGKHLAIDEHQTRYVVRQLRRYGLPVRYKGVASKPPTVEGRIVLREPRTCPSGVAGLGGGGSYLVRDDGTDVMVSTGVQICPAGYREDRAYLRSVYLHEFGHAVGLGHIDWYAGHREVMSPIATTFTEYQAGDVNGLRAIAANTARVAAG